MGEGGVVCRLLFCFEEVQLEKLKLKALILKFNPFFPASTPSCASG